MKNLIFSVLAFTAVFVLSGSLEAQTSWSCQFDESILNSDAEYYFAFKGLGKIQDASVSDPDFAGLVTAELVGISGKDLDYGDQFSIFSEYDDSGEKGVLVTVLGDPDKNSALFTTIANAAIPVSYLELMQEQELDRLPLAPPVEIKDITFSKDQLYVKYCTIASNKKTESEEFGEVGAGQLQVCFNNNTDFSAGENFKITMMAELVVGQDLLANYEGAETMDDLCDCYVTSGRERVDCSTIEWDESGNDGGADHYFKFKGKGIINQENTDHPDFITSPTSELAGVEGKELSSPSSFFMEYTLQVSDPDLKKWVALEVIGDTDSSGYYSTVVFVLIPVYYLNIMIEDELDVMTSAPITLVRDYHYSKDHVFARECTVAANNGEGDGEFQVAFENNIDFSAGETFDLTMKVELAVGQELIDSLDVETEEELCRCYKISGGGDVECSEIDWNGSVGDSDGGDTESDISEDPADTGDDDSIDAGETEDSDALDDADAQAEKSNGGSGGCSMLFF